MTYGPYLSFDEVSRIAQAPCRTILRELQAAEEAYQRLLDAQAGQSVILWSRDLYQLPDTDFVTLSVVASTGVVSCRTGANLFSNFQIGQDVQLSGFTNGGNNKTTEILDQTSDSITVVNTSMVDETEDPNARAQQTATTPQTDSVTALVNAMLALHELYGAMTNETTATADRAALLRDFA